VDATATVAAAAGWAAGAKFHSAVPSSCQASTPCFCWHQQQHNPSAAALGCTSKLAGFPLQPMLPYASAKNAVLYLQEAVRQQHVCLGTTREPVFISEECFRLASSSGRCPTAADVRAARFALGPTLLSFSTVFFPTGSGARPSSRFGPTMQGEPYRARS